MQLEAFAQGECSGKGAGRVTALIEFITMRPDSEREIERVLRERESYKDGEYNCRKRT